VNKFLLLIIFVILACNTPTQPPPPETQTEEPLTFDVVIQDGLVLQWYSDPAFDDYIIPAEWQKDLDHCEDTQKDPCAIVTSVIDYRCTVLPDTLYGLIVRPYDKLECIADTCRSLFDIDVVYDIRAYRERMIDICD